MGRIAIRRLGRRDGGLPLPPALFELRPMGRLQSALRTVAVTERFNCRKASGQEKCDAWDTAGRLSRSPFTRAASASSGDGSSAADRLNGGNVSAAMAAIAARRLNSCSVMALFLGPARCLVIQPVGQLCKFQFPLRTENFPIPIRDASREIARFQLLPRGDNSSPAPAGVLRQHLRHRIKG